MMEKAWGMEAGQTTPLGAMGERGRTELMTRPVAETQLR